jgi:predicted transcriptional regulator
MEATVTIRLDSEARRKIARIAERRRISKSEVIRRAINAWPEFCEPEKSPYELIRKFIGAVNGGDPKRSENGGQKFKAHLREKHKRSKL